MTSVEAVAEVDRLTDLALALPPALRELVAYRIWESLHPGENFPLDQGQLEVILKRAEEIDDGKVQLVDGPSAIQAARARIANRRG